MRILLIEDDLVLGDAIREHIETEAHSVDWAERLDKAAAFIRAAPYDLILLDLMLPDGLGLPFLRQQRTEGLRTPVIILTAMDSISDRIDGLNAGADDYLVKPFDLCELSARLAAVARRYHGNPNPLLHLGELTVDHARRHVERNGKPVVLTAREWALFETLIARPGRLLSKTQLETALYAFDDEFESNTIEAHISRMRKKLGREAIETVRGMGYRLRETS